MASTRALAVMDCLRRSRSSSRNPPAERRLKNATPSSHASTSQGRVSSDGESRETPVEVFAAVLFAPVGCVSAAKKGFAGTGAPENALDDDRKKNVATGAASIRASAATASM